MKQQINQLQRQNTEHLNIHIQLRQTKYNDIVPTDAGTYYVKATVEETDKYTGLESDAVEFVIGKKTLTNDNITDITRSSIYRWRK